MLEITGLSAGYGKKEIIHKLELILPVNKVIALIGPNGCGKSTLLKTIARQIAPMKGYIKFDEKNITHYSRKEYAKKVSFLPQERQIPDMTVECCVLCGRFPYFGFTQAPSLKDRTIAEEAMRTTGVISYRKRNLKELSGGERQKVYLAMLIAQDTELILLDEPTSFLDIAKQFEFLGLVRSLVDHGKTVIMVLHELSHAFTYSDYAGVLQAGKLQMFDTPDHVYQSGCIQEVFHIDIKKIVTEKGEYFQLIPL